jgi:hypothetical protein
VLPGVQGDSAGEGDPAEMGLLDKGLYLAPLKMKLSCILMKHCPLEGSPGYTADWQCIPS